MPRKASRGGCRLRTAERIDAISFRIKPTDDSSTRRRAGGRKEGRKEDGTRSRAHTGAHARGIAELARSAEEARGIGSGDGEGRGGGGGGGVRETYLFDMRRDCTRVSLIEDRGNEHGRQQPSRHARVSSSPSRFFPLALYAYTRPRRASLMYPPRTPGGASRMRSHDATDPRLAYRISRRLSEKFQRGIIGQFFFF